MTITAIDPQSFAELSKEGQKIDLIDVRTPVEFREVHVESARNVPLDQLDPAALMQARNGSANEPLYFICRSGSRGQQACAKLLIPVDDLQSRLDELPRDRKIAAYCQVGQRGYLATRILLQAGFSALNVGGGYKTYKLLHPNNSHSFY